MSNRGGAIMIRGKGHYRKPDPLLVLAAAVVLGAVLTTAAMAGETFNILARPGSGYQAPSPRDAGFSVASLGENGANLRVSLTPPRGYSRENADGRVRTQGKETLSNVYFFLRYPW
jgi:hypothetical protein